jgi:hypothetical protein
MITNSTSTTNHAGRTTRRRFAFVLVLLTGARKTSGAANMRDR